MDNVLVILDSDKKYVRKLSSYMENNLEMPFSIEGFDSKTRLFTYLQTHKIALLLIEESLWDEDFLLSVEHVIFFTDSRSAECLDQDSIKKGYPTICKYQSGDAICKKLIGICAAFPKGISVNGLTQKRENGTRCEIIGIYSPVKRSLQTSFSLIYSRMRAKTKKTLYLNFEVFSGFSVWFQREFRTDLLDLMYFLRDDPERFLIKLAGMTEKFGDVKYIPPAYSYEDFLLIESEQWIKLIETIANNSDYEVLVLELSDQMRGMFDLLSLCDRVYTMVKSDGLAMAKIANYEELLKRAGKEQVIQKTVKCRLPVFKNIPQEVEALSYSQLADYMKNKMGDELGI